jgi:hypothetical protein
MLCAGKGAALVRFFAEPQRLFARAAVLACGSRAFSRLFLAAEHR